MDAWTAKRFRLPAGLLKIFEEEDENEGEDEY